MPLGKLLFREKGFCVDGDERRRRGSVIREVGHSEVSSAGIGRVLNKVPKVALGPRATPRRLGGAIKYVGGQPTCGAVSTCGRSLNVRIVAETFGARAIPRCGTAWSRCGSEFQLTKSNGLRAVRELTKRSGTAQEYIVDGEREETRAAR